MLRPPILNASLFITSLFFGFNIMAPSSAGTSTPKGWLTQLDASMQAAYEENDIPGMAIAVVQGSQTLLAKGYGLRDVENNLPADENTLFHIASTQKSMNAMLIATLVDEGSVDWDTPVKQYYPKFQLNTPPDNGSHVTLRHLLSMSSGIPDTAENLLPTDATVQDVFAAAQQATSLGEPGKHFSYSNISASIAGYIGVIAETGNDHSLVAGYSDLLHTKILRPIGMSRSTNRISIARQDDNLAKAYTTSFFGKIFGKITPYVSIDSDSDILAPAGSLKSSAKEMALYLSTQLNQGVAPNGNRVVSAAKLQQTWHPVLQNYALGWGITNYRDVKVLMHTGSFDGFVSVIVMLPEKNIAFVLLANSEAAEELTEDAHEMLIDALQQGSNQ